MHHADVPESCILMYVTYICHVFTHIEFASWTQVVLSNFVLDISPLMVNLGTRAWLLSLKLSSFQIWNSSPVPRCTVPEAVVEHRYVHVKIHRWSCPKTADESAHPETVPWLHRESKQGDWSMVYTGHMWGLLAPGLCVPILKEYQKSVWGSARQNKPCQGFQYTNKIGRASCRERV